MAYQRLTVSITSEAPLLLGGPAGLGNYLETSSYVPGSSLRGAIATRLLNRCSEPQHTDDHLTTPPSDEANCPFYEIFGRGDEPLFGNCYPSEEGHSFPLPATARTCKTHAGFIDPGDPDQHHGVFDILVRQLIFEEALQKGQPLAFLYESVCPVCYGGVKEADSFYQKGLLTDYIQPKVKTERVSHTAINRAREVAEDALLYTAETVEPRSTFVGQVIVSKDKADALLSVFNGRFELGRGAARGWGAVHIEAQVAPLLWSESVDKRVATFNNLLEDERHFYHKLAGQTYQPDGSWYFTVDLLADAWLTEDGLPSLRLPPSELNLSDQDTEITLVRSFLASSLDSGWLTAAKLPRDTALLVKRGSLFVYRVSAQANQVALLDDLQTLELMGIGQGRERGLGQLVICSPFHTEVDPK